MTRAFFTLIPLRRYWNWQKKSLAFFDVSILRFFFDAYLHLTVMIACLRLDSQSSPVNFCAQAADFVSSKFPIWAFKNRFLSIRCGGVAILAIGVEPLCSIIRPIFPNLDPFPILTEICLILFITFANSWPQGLPAHFPQSGPPPIPYWNMPHSLYNIYQFWAPVPPGPFSPIWTPSQSLSKYATFSL